MTKYHFIQIGVLITFMVAGTLQAKSIDPTQASAWGSKVSGALCLRTVTCSTNQQTITLEGCVAAMQPLLAEAFVQKGTSFNDEKIDSCVLAIGEETCESLSQSVPSQCKFLKGIIEAKTTK